MKRIVVIVVFMLGLFVLPTNGVKAQFAIAEIIKEGVKRVIRAVDLAIQRLQNETIWLQNAQKAIENTMSKLKLDEISEWVERQRVLYRDYFEELSKVKLIIAYYHRIRDITDKQVRIVEGYKRAYALFRKDDHFTAEEVLYMGKVYTGMLDESLQNVERLLLVVNSFTLSMPDAKRMELINEAADGMDKVYQDLQGFNRQNTLLSLQRAKDQRDVDVIRKLYGL